MIKIILGIFVVSVLVLTFQHLFLKPELAARFVQRREALARLEAELATFDGASPDAADNATRGTTDTGEPRTAPSASAAPTEIASEELERIVRSATVRVINLSRETAGSGVIIGRSGPVIYILSAQHVVEGADNISLQLPAQGSSIEAININEQVEVVAKSTAADVALLRTSGIDPQVAALRVCPIEQIPRDFPVDMFAAGWSETRQPVVATVEILGEKKVRKSKGEAETMVWEAKGEAIKGRSGGPLVDRRGNVLGIASGTTDDRSYFTHAQAIHSFLKQDGLRWLYDEAPPTP